MSRGKSSHLVWTYRSVHQTTKLKQLCLHKYKTKSNIFHNGLP